MAAIEQIRVIDAKYIQLASVSSLLYHQKAFHVSTSRGNPSSPPSAQTRHSAARCMDLGAYKPNTNSARARLVVVFGDSLTFQITSALLTG
jgi:hypothetical protein